MTAVRLLITGIGGAVGTGLAVALAADAPWAEVVGVFSNERSRDAFLSRSSDAVRARVQPVVRDLTDGPSTLALARELAPARRTVVVHAAADVSWTASLEAARRGNVAVTRNVAELARVLGGDTRFVYVSSAYTAVEGWEYRNTYEATKAEAERLLRSDYADLRPVVFSCSLVVGHSRTGAIGRFHGIYPLLGLIDRHEPPLLPGGRDRRIDIVPVDWVASELAAVAHRTAGGGPVADVVASSGTAAPRLEELVAGAVAALNRARAQAERAPVRELTLVPFRRWEFLRRSLDAWQVHGIPMPPRAFLDRLIGVYRPYFEDDRVLPPTGTVGPCPHWTEFLDPAVGYWFAQQPVRSKALLRTGGAG
ncbi:SDR family oxidoreductase [Streptomyces sp. AC550_RSS872]|uniref:SDR family oxidoreductase n=1 Tax=Streptomyces sp. AC550_RSS872 TaxID=2823689 RepID=UPI001C272012|nr:SDR family oxidoreductase [Streptomyces sp. AC550_RSS872]